MTLATLDNVVATVGDGCHTVSLTIDEDARSSGRSASSPGAGSDMAADVVSNGCEIRMSGVAGIDSHYFVPASSFASSRWGPGYNDLRDAPQRRRPWPPATPGPSRGRSRHYHRALHARGELHQGCPGGDHRSEEGRAWRLAYVVVLALAGTAIVLALIGASSDSSLSG